MRPSKQSLLAIPVILSILIPITAIGQQDVDVYAGVLGSHGLYFIDPQLRWIAGDLEDPATWTAISEGLSLSTIPTVPINLYEAPLPIPGIVEQSGSYVAFIATTPPNQQAINGLATVDFGFQTAVEIAPQGSAQGFKIYLREDTLSGAGRLNLVVTYTPFEAGGTGISFRQQIQPIFNQSCAVNGCHAGDHPSLGLRLSESFAYIHLVDQPSVEDGGLWRVLPYNSSQSYLVLKLLGTAAIGSQMPLFGVPLEAQTIQLIRDWIDQGAFNN